MPATQEDVNELLTTYQMVIAATEYVGKLKFQMEQVSGDNYCMVWSERYDKFPTAED
jgi:hypothetical protein